MEIKLKYFVDDYLNKDFSVEEIELLLIDCLDKHFCEDDFDYKLVNAYRQDLKGEK